MPVDGNWGHWAEWGDCSVTCGYGQRVITRRCDNPPPRNGGAYCQSDPYGDMRTVDCFVPPGPSKYIHPILDSIVDDVMSLLQSTAIKRWYKLQVGSLR